MHEFEGQETPRSAPEGDRVGEREGEKSDRVPRVSWLGVAKVGFLSSGEVRLGRRFGRMREEWDDLMM